FRQPGRRRRPGRHGRRDRAPDPRRGADVAADSRLCPVRTGAGTYPSERVVSATGDLHATNVGEKFARLAAMRRAGLPVPAFFCIPARHYRLAASGLREQIERELAAVDFDQPHTVRAAAGHIKALFAAVPLPDEKAILAEFDRSFGPAARVALRAC